MRLTALSVNGFRGFPTVQEFDLDSDAVILVGANGSGKTSFFDALLWAVVGKVPRLGDDDQALVSRYSATGEARVEAAFKRSDGSSLKVVRRFDGAMNLSVEIEGELPLRGPSAEARLLEDLWPDARLASEPWEALSRALTRGVYLQQDLLREFIEADGDQDRFNVIGEIVGAGRVGELQRQLDSGKTGWTRATNALAAELEPLRARRAALAQRLSRLSEISTEGENLSGEWRQWLQALQGFLTVPEVPADSPDAARFLDSTLKQLEALEMQAGRRAASLSQLLRHLEAPPPHASAVEPLRQALAAAEQAAATSRTLLRAAQEQAAAERTRLVALHEQNEELRALAQLALRHLGEHCPVCEQQYDVDATRARLERLTEEASSEEQAPRPSIDLEKLSAAVEQEERLVAEATAGLRDAEQAHAVREDWEKARQQLVSAETELEDDAKLADRAAELRETLSRQQGMLTNLRRQGEGFALRLARASELAQRAELERELAELDAQLQQEDAELTARSATGELAGNLLNALRDAGSELVAAELARIEPLLQRIYAAVDPHPAFRAVRFLTRTVRGRGRLWTSIDDLTAKVSVEEPATVLSSSQLNVLAVSVFLALNLGVETLPLDVLALDDPLQSLDDVNLLGLVDLLRRIKGQRQVIVSTHDSRLGALLVRKLRPVTSDERVRLIELGGWTRDGPIVDASLVQADPKPLRLVA